jgi:hypothetical protein
MQGWLQRFIFNLDRNLYSLQGLNKSWNVEDYCASEGKEECCFGSILLVFTQLCISKP